MRGGILRLARLGTCTAAAALLCAALIGTVPERTTVPNYKLHSAAPYLAPVARGGVSCGGSEGID